MLEVQSFVNAPVTSNCYVLFDKEQSRDCIIVDPGTKDNKNLVDFLNKEELAPKYIILTHEHFDHCWGVNDLVVHYDIPIICSQLCAEAIKNEKRNCSVFYNNTMSFSITSKTINIESLRGRLHYGKSMFFFYMTPGHTMASISVVIEKKLFTGDTLIKDERTLTKLPSGFIAQLQETLMFYSNFQGKGYMVYPGHGNMFELDKYDLKLMVNEKSRLF